MSPEPENNQFIGLEKVIIISLSNNYFDKNIDLKGIVSDTIFSRNLIIFELSRAKKILVSR